MADGDTNSTFDSADWAFEKPAEYEPAPPKKLGRRFFAEADSMHLVSEPVGITEKPSRKVVLREERSGPDQRYLWAYFGEDGALHVDGQDLGPATAPVSADGEYEWFSTIRPAHLPRLVELLGGEAGTDLLDLLAERYTGADAAEFERILRESGIPVERFVY